MDAITIVIILAIIIVAGVFVYQGIQRTLNEKDKPATKPKRTKK